MAEIFNQGLQAGNFRYFIARGRSAEQMADYDMAAYQFKLDVQRFANAHDGAVACVSNNSHQASIAGLDFGRQKAPAGWQPGEGGAMTPTAVNAFSAGARAVMQFLHLDHPHTYLGAAPKGGAVPVARATDDGWIIASPVVNGRAFVPQDAEEISLEAYAALTGQQSGHVQSPAGDATFGNPFAGEYPFKAAARPGPVYALA